MDYKKFEEVLKRNNLNKKDFSEITNLSYQTIMNWSRNNNVPSWFDSWIENFEEAQIYKELKEKVLSIEKKRLLKDQCNEGSSSQKKRSQ